jgi:hypothetical protein
VSGREFTQGASAVIHLANIAHNLPFLHACSVLNDILEQLRDENHFQCKGRTLGALVKESEHHLPWNNFALIKEIVWRRNGLAHHSNILPREDCWRYIDAIEQELVAWKIVNPST